MAAVIGTAGRVDYLSVMHVSFALFADAANISQEGKLNILGVFDSVQVGQFPALHPRTTFVLRLKARPQDAGVHPLTLRWMNPRGAELWSSQAELDIGGAPPGSGELDMPVVVQLDLPLDMPGTYRMQVEIDGQQTVGTALYVAGGVAPAVPPAAGQMVS
jgi:hypothetical protein